MERYEDILAVAENDNETPMKRFDDLLTRVFKAGKRKPKEAEADAEEVMEGGIPPTGEAADE
ncbi:MAG: hypothetical protein WB438_05450 [Candidatus Cybelea sp.]